MLECFVPRLAKQSSPLVTMPLKDHLNSIFDVFSHRHATSGHGCKPDEVSERLRNRILLLIREVFSGKWPADRRSLSGDCIPECWSDMHNKLQHLYGRLKLSDEPEEREPWEDTL